MDYCCPYCLGKLEKKARQMSCPQCDKQFSERNGVPVFAKDESFYYGELPKEKMATLIELAEESGWQQAFSKLLQIIPEHKKHDISQYAMDGTRAAWKYLLDLKPDGKALDFGCGWSNISICLSRSFGHVYAMDLTWERLKFLKLKADQLQRTNITPVLGGDTPHFPFPDNYFDLVTLNGVLEWVPVSNPGNPREVQKALLKEIKRILKPDGQLYIGIENRIGFLYFVGRPEDHTGLLFGSLMPRMFSDIYSRLKKGKPYRTYIYSRKGYERLLSESGFGSTSYYSPVPDYRDFSQILDLDSEQELSPFFDLTRFRHKVKHNLYASRVFNPSFSIVTSACGSSSGFIPVLLKEVADKLALPEGSLRLEKYLVSQTNNVILLCDSSDKKAAPVVIKLPLNERADERTANHNRTLGELQKVFAGSPEWAAFSPKPLLADKLANQHYYVEERISGHSASHLAQDEQKTNEIQVKALDYISQLHQKTARATKIDEKSAQKLWGQSIAKISNLTVEEELKQFFASLDKYLTYQFVNKTVNLVRSHGDFWVGNVLSEPDTTRIKGIIDWDISREQGWPVLDLWYMVAYSMKLRKGRFSWGEMFRELVWQEEFDPRFREIIGQYQKKLGVSPELVQPLKVCLWLNYLEEYMQHFLYVDAYWEQQNLYGVIKFLREQLNL